jgi:predicted  nucleic acid-binding Zn-ribbon protein
MNVTMNDQPIDWLHPSQHMLAGRQAGRDEMQHTINQMEEDHAEIAERDAEIERLKAKNNILKEASARGGLDQMQGMISALEIRLADANKSAEKADAKVERLERELADERERFERLKRCLYRYNAKYLFDQFESGEREAKEQQEFPKGYRFTVNEATGNVYDGRKAKEQYDEPN